MFVAIKIPVRKKLEETIFSLQEKLKDEKIKWVDPDNLHLTLFFLGDTPDPLLPDITSGLSKLAETSMQLKIRCSGLGVFRDFRDPKVIWVGIEPNPVLADLQSGIRSVLTELGFKPDNRPFSPHLTIGRPKWIRDKTTFRESIEAKNVGLFQESVVHEIILFESILTGRGPIYRSVKVCTLKAP